MTDAPALTSAMLADIQHRVDALPARLDDAALARVVPEVAVLATNAEAAGAYRTALAAAERAELERVAPLADVAPRTVGAAYGWWSVIAAALGLVAPALVIAGWVSSSAPDPVSMALAAGIAMLVALGLLVWLEPRRTSSPLYRGGNFAGGLFIFYAALWAGSALILFGRLDDVVADPAAVIGLVLVILAALGCAALAPVAIRHDRERPQWADGERVRAAGVPGETAADPAFRSAVDATLQQWRRQAYRVSTAPERAALQAAEMQVVRLLAERGTISSGQARAAEQRATDRAAWL